MHDENQTSRLQNLEQDESVKAPSDFILDRDNLDINAYNEAVVMIYKFQGKLKANAAGRSLVEAVAEGLTLSRRATAWQTNLLPVAAQLPNAPAGATPLTFSDLAERISSQLREVMSTGKQILAASRCMSDGVQDLSEGAATLKQLLTTQVKY